ncbi:MAG: hypothetical protein GX984_05130 [Erysipelothrix sp.]|nr:hypothetical protein [Erysipelothrix sp.]
MKKSIKKLSILTLIISLFVLTTYALSSTTSTGSVVWSGDIFSVRATARWEYTTGKYAGPGNFTTTKKPSNTVFHHYDVVYNSRGPLGGYSAVQYYQPRIFNVLSGITNYGPIIVVNFSSPGPM